ncbi:FAD-dependent monooxygenase [Antrihabitans cavernicola]|nr:FAD-dependent monooxygenase [Spelaeibacter cavernicola]
METRRVLISGAGIAGVTLGYWLARDGFDVTILERTQQQRSSGNPVDIRGEAMSVVAKMGLLDELRASATTARRAVIVAADGSAVARMATQNDVGSGRSSEEIEIPRADLVGVLIRSVASKVDLRWGESIASLAPRDRGVDVTLTSGAEITVDLVIGADGVRSHTRGLAFDADARRTYLGLYIATTRAPDLAVLPDEVQIYNEPGRMVSVHPGTGTPIIAYMFHRPEVARFDYRDGDAHRALVADAFAGGGWRTAELLERTMASDDVFLDAIAAVRVPNWSNGRVGLVGDAASSVSLLGNGSSKAIIGAHTLAAELAATTDHAHAFRRYQQIHQPKVSSATAVRLGARFLVPRHRLDLALRNRALRAVRSSA